MYPLVFLRTSVRTITWNAEIVLVAAFSSAFHADIWGAYSVKPPTQSMAETFQIC